LPDGSTGLSEGGDGQGLSLLALSRAPGTIPSHVNPPRGPVTSPEEPLAASMGPATAPAPAVAPATRVASVVPNAQSDGFFSNLARKVGLGSADTTATAPPPVAAKPKVIEAKRSVPPRVPEASAPKAPTPAAPETKQAAVRPPLKQTLDAQAAAAPAAKDGMVAGSQPIVPPNSFDSRFSAFK
jgi:hypothetical protein